ncbi:MAG: tetratricopeptide repeat protein [Novosphingobium sp.]
MTQPGRLQRLLGYLEADPTNLALLGDAANAAIDESRLEAAAGLLERYRTLAPLPPGLLNAEGVVAMRSGRYEQARTAFTALRQAGHDHPAIRFNLAWLSAVEGDFASVVALADDAVIQAVPRAATLKVQALHHLGDLDAALAFGQALLAQRPGDDDLLGALSVAAMDADDYALAARLAGQAQGGADALTTRGLVALNEEDAPRAMDLFDEALADHPDAPRAWIGKGLGLLVTGDLDGAAPLLEKGAGIFATHLGSWLAAGWAQFLRRDLAAARRNFETALQQDDTFAETHGALAVVDLAEGKIDSAKRRTDIALRLDKDCFGAALARMMLLQMQGNPQLAERIRDRALSLPAGVNGKTLAQAIAGFGLTAGKGGKPQ